MPNNILENAVAFRKKTEEVATLAAPNMADAEKLEYIDLFPKFDPANSGYPLKAVINYNGKLYENLMGGNRMSPDEYSYAWRWIDPDATDFDLI